MNLNQMTIMSISAVESAELRQRRSSQEELPMPEARGSSQEEQPHIQGVVAARAGGPEDLFHIQGQEGWQ